MTIVQAIIEARRQMPALVPDKAVEVGGRVRFRYVSLQNMVDTVMKALLDNNILLTQSIGSLAEKPNVITIQTCLSHGDGETIQSDVFHIEALGDSKAMGGQITTARRIQLTAMLGLSEEDDSPPVVAPNSTRQEAATKVADATPRGDSSAAPRDVDRQWQEQAPLRKAVALAQSAMPRSVELGTLMQRLRQDDGKGGPLMARTPVEGKSLSVYDYVRMKMSVSVHEAERILSYLYGRVITEEFPPHATTDWFARELQEQQHKEAIAEATRLSQGTA